MGVMETPPPAPPPKSSFWVAGRSLPPVPKPKEMRDTGRTVVPSGVVMGFPITELESMRVCRFFMELSVSSLMGFTAI